MTPLVILTSVARPSLQSQDMGMVIYNMNVDVDNADEILHLTDGKPDKSSGH